MKSSDFFEILNLWVYLWWLYSFDLRSTFLYFWMPVQWSIRHIAFYTICGLVCWDLQRVIWILGVKPHYTQSLAPRCHLTNCIVYRPFPHYLFPISILCDGLDKDGLNLQIYHKFFGEIHRFTKILINPFEIFRF